MAPRKKADRIETAQDRMKRLERELEQARQDAAVEAEEMAKAGPRKVALTIALKEIIAAVRNELGPDAPEWVLNVVPQTFPKEKIIGRRHGLSDTEIHNAAEKARKTVAGL